MKGIDFQRLLDAFADSQATSGPEAGLAADITAAVRGRSPLCPPRARHRAYALIEQLPASLWETVAQVVFDSWQGLAPAARSLGTERLMRFEAGLGAVDVQIARDPLDDHVAVAVAVEGMTGARVQVHVFVDGAAGPAVGIPLDEDGTGSTRLPSGGQQVVVAVFDEDGEVMRTPPIGAN